MRHADSTVLNRAGDNRSLAVTLTVPTGEVSDTSDVRAENATSHFFSVGTIRLGTAYTRKFIALFFRSGHFRA